MAFEAHGAFHPKVPQHLRTWAKEAAGRHAQPVSLQSALLRRWALRLSAILVRPQVCFVLAATAVSPDPPAGRSAADSEQRQERSFGIRLFHSVPEGPQLADVELHS